MLDNKYHSNQQSVVTLRFFQPTNQSINQNVSWLKLRGKSLTLKIVIPELSVQRTVVVISLSLSLSLYHYIIIITSLHQYDMTYLSAIQVYPPNDNSTNSSYYQQIQTPDRKEYSEITPMGKISIQFQSHEIYLYRQ